MKLLHMCLCILAFVDICQGDNLEIREVEIEYPAHHEIPQPLIVTVTWKSSEREHVERYKYQPMIYDRYSVTDGKESIVGSDDQWSEYYDAFPTFDRRNYILVRRWDNPEASKLLEIRLDCQVLENPKGDCIFWSKDGKYLVTGIMHSPFVVDRLTLYFYDFKQTEKKVELHHEKQFDNSESLKVYIKEHLICTEPSEDVKLIIHGEK